MLECSICLDSLQGDDAALSSLRCGHLLHADCLAQHLAVYPRCPICSAHTYPNDPTIRRIYLSAPEQRTPSPEAESALELVQVKQTLARTGIQLENERIEKEAVERELILLSRERQAAEEKLQRAEHTKQRYKRERDDIHAQLITTSERLRQETESREREKTKAGQQEKMLRVQISNLNLALKAKPPLRQSHLVAASPAPPNTRASSKRLVGATSSLEILPSPPPPQKRTRLSDKKRRSESVSAGKKKKRRDFLDDEDEEEEEEEDGSATEEEELEELEEELVLEDGDGGEEIDVDVEQEEEEVGDLRLTVSYSGRGNPSVELGVKGSDTIRTLGKAFLARSGMKPTSFKGPTGIIYDRIRNKNKTVAELRGGTQMLNVSALGCVRPT